jgi:4-azaleucine resistance transporter AzlC
MLAAMTTPRSRPPFAWRGFRAGLIGGLILTPGVTLFGAAVGVIASAAGLSVAEAVLMSGWVFSGSAQMATLQAWSDPLPLLAVCLTTLAMNARYLLLGAALRPWFAGLPAYQSYTSLFVLGDGNWALALRERAEGRDDAAYLAGSGALLWFVWAAATAAGSVFGQILGDPKRFGVDFMLAAFFATMAVAFFRQARGILPLIVGVVAAIIVERLVAGPWYILAGALAGSLAGAIRHDDPA